MLFGKCISSCVCFTFRSHDAGWKALYRETVVWADVQRWRHSKILQVDFSSSYKQLFLTNLRFVLMKNLGKNSVTKTSRMITWKGVSLPWIYDTLNNSEPRIRENYENIWGWGLSHVAFIKKSVVGCVEDNPGSPSSPTLTLQPSTLIPLFFRSFFESHYLQLSSCNSFRLNRKSSPHTLSNCLGSIGDASKDDFAGFDRYVI